MKKIMHDPTPGTFFLATLALTIALSACSNDLGQRAGREGASAKIGTQKAQALEDAKRLENNSETGRPANVNVRDGMYLGEDGFRTGRGDPLPRKFEQEKGISLNMARKVDLREFAIALRRATGIRVDFRDIASSGNLLGNRTSGNSDRGGAESRADSTGGEDVSLRDIASGRAGAQDAARARQASQADTSRDSTSPLEMKFRVSYLGPLSGLLDQISTRIGVDWEYRGGRIQFLGPQTVTYTLWSLPGDIESESTVGGGGSSDVFGGSSPAETTRTISGNYWDEIESGLENIMPRDSRYTLNKSSGTITVTAFQNVHDRVSRFIQTENARLSRQVSVKVDVISYTANESDTRGTDYNLNIFDILGGVSLNAASASGTIDGAGNLDINIVDSDFEGTSAIIRALSAQGEASVLNSASVIATNNSPTPVSILNEKAFLSGSESEIDDETGDETTDLETGIINNGLNLVITPRILSSGMVNIHYAMNISELLDIETFDAGDSSVQLPEIETRNFMQNVSIESGDTMVIAAYDDGRTSRQASGPFNPRLWGLGGRDSYAIENTKIVILMTPVVIEKQNAPRARR